MRAILVSKRHELHPHESVERDETERVRLVRTRRHQAWAPDSQAGHGRSLLLSRRQDANRWQLIRVDVDTGAVQPTTTAFDRRLGAIDLAPDGSRIAIMTRVYLSETKVLDNVLSALR